MKRVLATTLFAAGALAGGGRGGDSGASGGVAFCDRKFVLAVAYHGNQMNNQMDEVFGALDICEATGRVCVLDGLSEAGAAPRERRRSSSSPLYSTGEDFWSAPKVKVPFSKYFDASAMAATYGDMIMDSSEFLRRVAAECRDGRRHVFSGHFHVWYKGWEADQGLKAKAAAEAFNNGGSGTRGRVVRMGDVRPTPDLAVVAGGGTGKPYGDLQLRDVRVFVNPPYHEAGYARALGDTLHADPDLLFVAKAARWVGADVPDTEEATRKMAAAFVWSRRIADAADGFVAHELGGPGSFIAVHERWDPTTPGLFLGKPTNEPRTVREHLRNLQKDGTLFRLADQAQQRGARGAVGATSRGGHRRLLHRFRLGAGGAATQPKDGIKEKKEGPPRIPVLFRASNKPLRSAAAAHARGAPARGAKLARLSTTEDWEALAAEFGLAFRTLSSPPASLAHDGGLVSAVEQAICEQAAHFVGAWGSSWSAMVEQRRLWMDALVQPGISAGYTLSVGDNETSAPCADIPGDCRCAWANAAACSVDDGSRCHRLCCGCHEG